eukprot:gnl/TRDRNA2_/TRDRNA2_163270_c0_seq4.p1 gnl/TRDRNA2_/TRDRNA2_163270_c0~~gnl/TRDRNA2_/TRDRNA2_163270_c0_seq4.p1  ORF type:complete len:187 (+),score=14.71 gnl/TRDRNA2_/TRDRNA2_163270_c0_seq4:446-1006(+)
MSHAGYTRDMPTRIDSGVQCSLNGSHLLTRHKQSPLPGPSSVGVPLASHGDGGRHESHKNAAHVTRQSKESPKELRDRVNKIWTALEKRGIYVPPLDEPEGNVDKPRDKYSFERHGHGRGNTKSTKKRRSLETKELLIQLLAHLEDLAFQHGVSLSSLTDSPCHGTSRTGCIVSDAETDSFEGLDW